MRTANPVLSTDTFTGFGYTSNTESMTISGVINKTFILLLLAFLGASWTWMQVFKTGSFDTVSTWVTVGLIGGLVAALVTTFKPAWAAITAPIYAALEGLFLGGVSALLEQSFPGIALQAILMTFGTLFAMLAAYRSGLIRATEKFKLGVVAATGGVAIVYLAAFVLSFFGVNLSFIYGNGVSGIAISLIVIVIAALNFVLDFDFIEQGASRGAPKYMEWFGAFALMLTLVWLYVEFLRLLAKLRSRN